jgi:predicted nucleic-acid-binding Zn-ribbon protein
MRRVLMLYCTRAIIMLPGHAGLYKKECILMDQERRNYVCPKCGNTQYESDQFQATGGNFAKLFDVQNKKFITLSCTQCGYTELYKAQTDTGMNILDFLMR